MEIAVADVAEHGRHQPGRGDVFHRLGQALGQPRDGHAGVGGERAAARAQLQAGEVRVVPRCPEPAALFLPGGPPEAPAAMLLRDRLQRLALLRHLRGGTAELEEQRGRRREARAAVRVDRLNRQRIQHLGARQRHAELDRLDHAVDRALHVGEIDDRRRDRLGLRVQLDRDLGDDAQRAFGAAEQLREAVAGGRLAGAPGGADHLAVGPHHRERQHVVAHRAVADGVGARGRGGHHAADRRVGAGIDREEEAGAGQLAVEVLARDAGRHRGRQVLGADRQHAVHSGQVDADSAPHRQQVALDRGADAERDDRHALGGAQLHDLRDFLRGLR